MASSFRIPGKALALGLATGLWIIPTANAGHTPPLAGREARLFQEYCAGCHGDGGTGDGPVTSRPNWSQIEAVDPSRKPRDLTRDWFRFGDDKAAIMRTIQNGSRDTAMTGFSKMLSHSDVEALADVVLVLRGDMSNDVILHRYPERIPKGPGGPLFHPRVYPVIRP